MKINTFLKLRKSTKTVWIVVLVASIVLILISTYLIYSHNKSSSYPICSEAISSIQNVNKQATNPQIMRESYNSISEKECRPEDTQRSNNIERFDFIYQRAVSGYSLGEYNASKADARLAIEQYEKLSDDLKQDPQNSIRLENLNKVLKDEF